MCPYTSLISLNHFSHILVLVIWNFSIPKKLEKKLKTKGKPKQPKERMAGKISFSKHELKEIGTACMSQAVNQQVPVEISDYVTSFKEVFKFDRPIPIWSKTTDKGSRWHKEHFVTQDGANNASITGKNQSHNKNVSLSNSSNQGGSVREKKLTRQEQLALFEKELEEHRKKNDKSLNSEAAVVYRYHDEGDELMKELEEEEKKKSGKKINISDLFGGNNAKSGSNVAASNVEIVQLNELESSNNTPSIFHTGNEYQQMQTKSNQKLKIGCLTFLINRLVQEVQPWIHSLI